MTLQLSNWCQHQFQIDLGNPFNSLVEFIPLMTSTILASIYSVNKIQETSNPRTSLPTPSVTLCLNLQQATFFPPVRPFTEYNSQTQQMTGARFADLHSSLKTFESQTDNIRVLEGIKKARMSLSTKKRHENKLYKEHSGLCIA